MTIKVEVLRAFLESGKTQEVGSVVDLAEDRVAKLLQRRMVRVHHPTKKKVRAVGIDAEKKLEKAIREGTIRRYHGIDWIGEAHKKDILSESEAQQLRELETLVARVIAVDHFDPQEVKPNFANLGHNSRAMEKAAE